MERHATYRIQPSGRSWRWAVETAEKRYRFRIRVTSKREATPQWDVSRGWGVHRTGSTFGLLAGIEEHIDLLAGIERRVGLGDGVDHLQHARVGSLLRAAGER